MLLAHRKRLAMQATRRAGHLGLLLVLAALAPTSGGDPMTPNRDQLLRQSYTVERQGTPHAPWCIIHRGTEFKVPVRRPYPGPESWLPPIDVCNFKTPAEAEAAAQEIDWPAVDELAKDPEVQKAAAQWRKRRDHDAASQVALANARAGLEPFPWEPGGFSHRGEVSPVESADLTLFDLPEAA